MSDVFISYAREDSDFVRRLQGHLLERNREVWVDLDEIPPTADWLDEIKRAIEAAEAFVFVISPDSMSSEICQKELSHAVGHHKRIMPLVVREVDSRLVPEPLAERNWIFMRESDDFETSVATLEQALDTDLDWARTHTELLRYAIAWEGGGRRSSALMRGNELSDAESWLASEARAGQQPTTLQREFILAGRRAVGRRQRLILGVVSVGLIVAIGLALLAVSQRNQAIEQRLRSTSLQLAALADSELKNDPERSLLLASEAAHESETDAAAASLRRALAASAVRARFDNPRAGPGEQGGLNAFCAVFSPDGTSLATTFGNGDAYIWNADTGVARIRLDVPADVLGSGQGAVFSPDGALVATPYTNRQFVFDTEKGELLASLTPDGTGANDAAFSPNGRLLATAGTDGLVRIWDRRSERIERSFDAHADAVNALAWSPDGNRVASVGADGAATVWSVKGSQSPLRLSVGRGPLNSVQFDADGDRILTAGPDDGAQVWDSASGRLLDSLGSQQSSGAETAVFSPDGKLIAEALAEGNVEIYSSDGAPSRTLRGHESAVVDLLFSPDGRLLATAGADSTARLWDPRTGQLLMTFRGHSANVVELGFNPDGSRMSTASNDGTARVWAVMEGDDPIELPGAHGDLTAIASSAGGLLATADDTGAVSLWRTAAEGLPERLGPSGTPAVRHLDFSEDGGLLVGAGDDSAARIWRIPNGKLIATLRGHTGAINAVAVGALGNPIVTAGQDGYARVWSPQGRPLAQFAASEEALRTVDVSPDGKLILTGGDDGVARLWDVGGGEPLHELAGHSAAIVEARFSPDGGRAATASQDKTARIWDPESGAEIAILTGHQGPVNDIHFDPAGERIITASDDGTARIWSAFSGDQEHELAVHDARVATASFSPDGETAASASFDGTARIWQVSDGQLIATLDGPGNFVSHALFDPDGGVTLAADDASSALLYPCRTCLPLEELEALASTRTTRELTPEERQTFIEGN